MDYNAFICCLQTSAQEKLGEKVRIMRHRVPQNNGVLLDGLAMMEQNCKISPTVYLNDFYREYEKGKTIDEIVEQILKIYEENRLTDCIDTDFYRDFQRVRDQVRCKLINYEKNRALLEQIPFIRYLDLAIVFYYQMQHERMGEGTILIYDSHLKMWQISEDELYEIARENTDARMPYSLCSMHQVLEEWMEEELGEECAQGAFPMYVLTNPERNLGAVEMVFDHVLSQVGETLQEDFFILPSSIHELIIVPVSAAPSRKELEEMVQDVNSSQVLPQEVLSEHVYYYRRRVHRLEM